MERAGDESGCGWDGGFGGGCGWLGMRFPRLEKGGGRRVNRRIIGPSDLRYITHRPEVFFVCNVARFVV